MITSIGIDAAWTVSQSSGVCLLKSIEGIECEIVRLTMGVRYHYGINSI